MNDKEKDNINKNNKNIINNVINNNNETEY